MRLESFQMYRYQFEFNYLLTKKTLFSEKLEKAELACLAVHNQMRFKHDVEYQNRYRLGYKKIRYSALVSCIKYKLFFYSNCILSLTVCMKTKERMKT